MTTAPQRKAIAPVPVLDQDTAAFLGRGLGMVIASRDANRCPNVCRAFGCRISKDRRLVTFFVSARQALGLLADYRANGALAATCSDPPTTRTLQLKGTVTKIAAATKGDVALVERYREEFVKCLVLLGYPEQTIRALVAAAASDLVAVTFRPTSVFAQTPGPGAGAPLKPGEKI